MTHGTCRQPAQACLRRAAPVLADGAVAGRPSLRVALACALAGCILTAQAAAADRPRTLHIAPAEALSVTDARGWMAVVDEVIAEWRRHGIDLRVADAGAAPEAADLSWTREVLGHDLDAEVLSVTMRACGAAGCRVSAVLNGAGLWLSGPDAAGASRAAPDRAQGVAPGAVGAAGQALATGEAGAGALQTSASAAASPGTVRSLARGGVEARAPGASGDPAAPGQAADAGMPRPDPAGRARQIAPVLASVVAHEIGHLLGLEHDDTSSDAAGALMAMAAGSGGTAGHGPSAGEAAGIAAAARSAAAVAATGSRFPPRNETFDFRAILEQKYQASLGRQALPTFVDVEGSVVWVQEYLRYRLEGCAHGEAAARVLRQILGEGVQPSCGAGGWSSAPPFPPRDETFAFRQQLEEVYRGTLGRGAVLSAVDPEGDVVWTQEYLRYRLSGCAHGLAVDAVLAQVDGLPAPLVCGAADNPAPGAPAPGDVVENPRRLAFFSPEHARFSAYQVGFFPFGAGDPVQVVLVPLGFVQQAGAEQVIDLAAAGLLPPPGQIFTFRARGVWSGGVTAWSEPSQPFIRR